MRVSLAPLPPERLSVPLDPAFERLDALVAQRPGLPSASSVSAIVSERGLQCQAFWKRRWFRAEVLRVYPTSLLLRWLDWPENREVPFRMPVLFRLNHC